MCCMIAPLLIGAVAGSLGSNEKRRRPAVRSLVKCGISAKRKVEALVTTAVAETRKIVDEARAELDSPGVETHR